VLCLSFDGVSQLLGSRRSTGKRHVRGGGGVVNTRNITDQKWVTTDSLLIDNHF
jgi:hypothetical protein